MKTESISSDRVSERAHNLSINLWVRLAQLGIEGASSLNPLELALSGNAVFGPKHDTTNPIGDKGIQLPLRKLKANTPLNVTWEIEQSLGRLYGCLVADGEILKTAPDVSIGPDDPRLKFASGRIGFSSQPLRNVLEINPGMSGFGRVDELNRGDIGGLLIAEGNIFMSSALKGYGESTGTGESFACIGGKIGDEEFKQRIIRLSKLGPFGLPLFPYPNAHVVVITDITRYPRKVVEGMLNVANASLAENGITAVTMNYRSWEQARHENFVVSSLLGEYIGNFSVMGDYHPIAETNGITRAAVYRKMSLLGES